MMTIRSARSAVWIALVLGLPACGGNGGEGPREPVAVDEEEERTFLPEGARCPQEVPEDVLSLRSADPNCSPRVDVVETDLNRDGHLDMRRVYLLACPTMLGEEVDPVILCRESDINFDGRKDIFHYFRDGESHYEEQDWDLDGTIDGRVYFSEGRPVSVEVDRDHNGGYEMQILISSGEVRRVKIDVVGDEHFDIYETYEIDPVVGRSVLRSIGYDLEGDGSVDRLLEYYGPIDDEAEAPEETADDGEAEGPPAAGEE